MRTFRTLMAFLILAIPAVLFGQIGIRVSIGPPAFLVCTSPMCPGMVLQLPAIGPMTTSQIITGFPVYGATSGSRLSLYWVPGWGEGGYTFNEGYWERP